MAPPLTRSQPMMTLPIPLHHPGPRDTGLPRPTSHQGPKHEYLTKGLLTYYVSQEEGGRGFRIACASVHSLYPMSSMAVNWLT